MALSEREEGAPDRKPLKRRDWRKAHEVWEVRPLEEALESRLSEVVAVVAEQERLEWSLSKQLLEKCKAHLARNVFDVALRALGKSHRVPHHTERLRLALQQFSFVSTLRAPAVVDVRRVERRHARLKQGVEKRLGVGPARITDEEWRAPIPMARDKVLHPFEGLVYSSVQCDSPFFGATP